VESLAVLPAWAQTTLAAHAGDEREAVYSWERLARGRTGDRLWDLAQTSLVRHGELHNNVRMTWGKALVGWTPSPERALATLVDLNHRFALDGSDPSSYGGLLWCLGLFDRPFEPERPVLGTVRDRSTARHAQRLDLERYAAKVEPPSTGRPLDVVVVGAGLSGLACARALADHGHRVRVIEKSRGPGGRTATRREGTWRFDHGAQYFTVRDPRFRRWVQSWLDDGLVAPWTGRVVALERGAVGPESDRTERYVGVPGMNALCRHLAEDLDVTWRTRVSRVERDGDRWRLTDDDGADLAVADAVVVSAPPAQTAEMLADAAPALADRARSVDMAPCWAAMAVFDRPLDLPFDGAFVRNSPLSWVARDASKPGRPDHEAWVLHAGPDWSQAHLELEREDAAAQLLEAFRDAVGRLDADALHLAAHRWRYALPREPLADPCLFDRGLRMAACGDWCGGPRVEGAFLSGCAAAGRLLGLRPEPVQTPLFGSAT
jgi:hypothetical protein